MGNTSHAHTSVKVTKILSKLYSILQIRWLESCLSKFWTCFISSLQLKTSILACQPKYRVKSTYYLYQKSLEDASEGAGIATVFKKWPILNFQLS